MTDRADLDAQVLVHRMIGIDRDREQVGGHLDLVEVLAPVFEQPLDALLTGELGDHRAKSAARGQHPQHRGDGRLADAPLARDEHQPLVEEPWHRAAE